MEAADMADMVDMVVGVDTVDMAVGVDIMGTGVIMMGGMVTMETGIMGVMVVGGAVIIALITIITIMAIQTNTITTQIRKCTTMMRMEALFTTKIQLLRFSH